MQQAPLEMNAGQEPDQAILGRMAAGDTDAFAGLMRRYNRRLFRVARGILRDDADAEDALQDAYLQAYRSLAAFRSDASLSTWLTRIVVNAALAQHRKHLRIARLIEPGADPEREDLAMAQAAAQPEGAALRAQTRRLIETRIDSLPDAFRAVFVLRALDELSVEETSDALGIPPATVRSRYFRARALLREGLPGEPELAPESIYPFDGARCDRIVAAVLRRLEQTLQA